MIKAYIDTIVAKIKVVCQQTRNYTLIAYAHVYLVISTQMAVLLAIPRQKRHIAYTVLSVFVLLSAIVVYTVSFSGIGNAKQKPTLIQSNADLVQDPEAQQEPDPKVPDEFDDQETETEDLGQYDIINDILEVQAVLVPQDTTVISSSRDGRIMNIPVRSGDIFKKNDILIQYDCRALEAEAEIAQTEKTLTEEKLSSAYKLFKLELLSNVERKNLEVEDLKASARQRLFQARMDDCIIRADFDGRVTNRLANAGEYTRTDRVLLEIASTAPLKADFLIPSKWLRWVNLGAPLDIMIQETGKTYEATITRIHGEVDPISQSIQITAQMETYEDRLLPGMSGQATLSIQDIQSAGVQGFLETTQSGQ